MTALADVERWLDTPAGHVAVALAGGRAAALAEIVRADQRERTAALDCRQAYERDYGRVLTDDEATFAVRRARSGGVLSGSSREVADSLRRHDPCWPVRVREDDPPPAPRMLGDAGWRERSAQIGG
jgi:hypothetical protein